MKPGKQFIVLFSLFLIIGKQYIYGQKYVSTIPDIIEQWTGIENHFVEGENINADVDEFNNAIQAFLETKIYRIYRLAPLSPDANLAPPPPNEISELRAAASLALDFREAVLHNKQEEALHIAAAVSDSLTRSLKQYWKLEQYVKTAYFRLLSVFIVFLTLTALAIWFLHKTLARSLVKEAEGSQYSRTILLAQEKERARISRELHDTIAQDLRGLSLGMEKIGLCPDKKERLKLCTEAASVQSTLIRRVRDICDYLVPPDFGFYGLPDALKRLCLEFGNRTGIDCRISITQKTSISFLNKEKQLQIFRIVQEALTNVEKHAEASEAIVILRCVEDGNIAVGISDDGKGFDPPDWDGETSYSGGNWGIRSMRERTALLGGTLKIDSGQSGGTLVRLEIPAHR